MSLHLEYIKQPDHFLRKRYIELKDGYDTLGKLLWRFYEAVGGN
jgi:hypothetical protein